MIRSIFMFALALAVIAPAIAVAQNPPPPTPQEIEQAKKAFGEGKKLHEAGKLPEAIEKFKESYRLSRNPLLLYNIGLTMDESGMEDLALFYYRKFLAEAPQDAAQRATVVERSKVLEKKFNPNATSSGTTPTPTPTPTPKPDEPRKPVVIKPPGTYSATDFQHQAIDVAPPAKPLDVTAFVPEDSGFVVTLYFRTAGEGKFTSKEMKWRYKELVGRIPAPKMIGNAVQYYIEVKDTAGTVVTRAGKSTSPNLVNLEAGASPRFYPDITEEGEVKLTATDIKRRDEEEDPLNKNKKVVVDDEPIGGPQFKEPETPAAPGNGFMDPGSKKFTYAKWGSTGVAAAMIGLSVFGYLQAGSYATALETDSKDCPGGAPPCRQFDDEDYAPGLIAAGERYQTISNVSLGVGIVAAGVAGFFWYKELTTKRRSEVRLGKAPPSPEAASWVVVPTLGDSRSGFLGGATAVTRF